MAGYIPQESLMINESLISNIQLAEGGDEQNKVKLDSSVMQAQLEQVVKDLPMGLETNIGENGIRLSGGQRQRVSVARVLYHSRQVLIFDEATSALDLETEAELLQSIENLRKDKTILIISHRNITLKNCDKIYKIENKKIKLN